MIFLIVTQNKQVISFREALNLQSHLACFGIAAYR